ncbi:4a-hydroxytetrahydrobiopterin dehydratase [Fontivita pretiosa]|uniref:4a-hydroxytetrahydrobiopterin dehydratase n=1 Tax=Fontivita pretiosa TaxID=2989684 RepID=UPI003D1771A8
MTSRLSDADIAAALGQLSGWQRVADQIVKTFSFRNYYETMAFVNAVAWIAHRLDHHPDLEVGYNSVKVRYTTHSAGGISQKDLDSAARIEQLM